MEHVVFLLAIAAYGAITRHLQGGWGGIQRHWVMVMYSIIPLPLAWHLFGVQWHGVPYLSLAAIGLWYCQMVLSQNFDRPWLVLARYGIAPLALAPFASGLGAAGLIAVGPICTAAAICLHRRDVRPWGKGFIDGWEAYLELIFGGVSALAWGLAAL